MTFPSQKPPTSAEVARQAGVSRTTVSFVLNGVLNRGISEATRERVLAVARSMGYQPNAAARSLASGQTGTVGVVIPKAAHLYVDAFLAQLVATVNEQCHALGLKMLIETTDDEGREPGGFVNLVRGRSIDGWRGRRLCSCCSGVACSSRVLTGTGDERKPRQQGQQCGCCFH